MELTTCPECHAPAEIVGREVWSSTDGPVEHARVRCVRRHFFCLPTERLRLASAWQDRAGAPMVDGDREVA